MGAEIIEKHFTYDISAVGPDHRASLPPDALKAFCSEVKSAKIMMGSGVKQAVKSEQNNKSVSRKVLVAATTLDKGMEIKPSMIATKRAPTGELPEYFWDFCGRRVKRKIVADQPINWTDVD